MFERAERMLIDVGNSFVHWQCGSARGQFSSKLASFVMPDEFLRALRASKCVLVVSVGHAAVVAQLRAAGADIEWHSAGTFPSSLLTSDYDTAALGYDRWMALLGWLSLARMNPSVMVIDAGTAVTIDFLDGTHHQGGWILPGYRTWFDSLLGNTQMRFTQPEQPQLQSGKQTAEAVANAWLESIVGIVERYRNQRTDLAIVVTGGDATRLISALPGAQVVADLVFNGLHFWYEQTGMNKTCGG
ncbi:type III pantothenate kinase [Salinispirillum sp. LH 10-3-1]|uniref:Type III pantothenate kinase n=1 Tax=Salinispirillum sp. LH 10-3-1 TaxID=2952525 RepID=A0AB38YEL7_9GAMM